MGKLIHKLIKEIMAGANRNGRGKHHTGRRVVSLLLCACMLMTTASTIALAEPASDSNGGIVAWEDIRDKADESGVYTDTAGVKQSDESNARIWDVSESTNRYLDVPVQINNASDQAVTITLPRYITSNIRNGSSCRAEVSTDAAATFCDSIKTEGEQVVLHLTGGHASFKLPYKFDCWNVVSGKKFTISYKIQIGEGEATSGTLTGKIKTGFDFEIVNDAGYYPDSYYSNAYGRDNGYSLNSLGGADRIMSYIQNCSSVYQKYFNVGKFDANPKTNGGDEELGYIYDIAPYFVKPKGQQPYDISGEVTVKNGEILSGVYLMDSRLGSKAPWKLLEDADGNKNDNSFTFNFNHNEEFDWQDKDGKQHSLIDKVVTGNLTENVDNKFYTLYFLVRYKISDLDDEQQRKVNSNSETAYILDAEINLTHTGVDSAIDKQRAKTKSHDQLLYRGPVTDPQIYDAYYTYFVTNQQDALSNLDGNETANLDFEADFFCFNEARDGFKAENEDKYRLEAVIDLLYLTENRPYEKSDQLEKGDYKFSQFSISLVDAPGSWSQNWYYEDRDKNKEEDDEVWNEHRPNIGWPVETWDKEDFDGYSQVIVYGSEDHEGNTWTEIRKFDVQDLWAKDKGRAVSDDKFENGDDKSNQFTISTGDYVRLKVVYDSRYTTALRLRYQIELKKDILEKHTFLKTGSNHGLTSWFNYFGYTKVKEAAGNNNSAWSADTTNMNVDGYYKSDADMSYKWEDDKAEQPSGDKGSIEQARQYDNEQSKGMDFHSKFNTNDNNRYERTYSMRDYVRTFLGRSNDMAGMLVTQALYNSTGIVGNNKNSTQLNSGSFSKEKTVNDVSEIVYSISGGITNGYLNKENLDSRRAKDKTGDLKSPYTSLKMRYFVLLPPGFKLNKDVTPNYTVKDPDELNKFLSATPSFYNNQKATGGEDYVVVTSNSNIPAWKEESANGALSEMKWNEAGSVTLNESLTKGRLVVFDRELEDETLDEVFNLHGATETYFWGRGLTFSIVPIDGTGDIRTGPYETQFWCQYLDKDEKPLSLTGFQKDIDGDGGTDVKDEELNKYLTGNSGGEQGKDTLLYIPGDFYNISPVGTAKATITLESDVKDKSGNPVVQFEKPYDYKLDFSSPDRKDENVVLWTNIEQEYKSKPQYRGIVTGVDISSLPEMLQKCVRIYVRDNFFDPKDYVGTGEGAANSNWLTQDQYGWTEISKEDLESHDWSNVKAVAFYFEDFIFNKYSQHEDGNNSDIESAIVKINMMGPERAGNYLELDGKPEKTFDAISRLYLSDTQDGNNSGCAFASEVPVSVTVRTVTLPESGGIGTTGFITAGLLLCLSGAALLLMTRLMKNRQRRGYHNRR